MARNKYNMPLPTYEPYKHEGIELSHREYDPPAVLYGYWDGPYEITNNIVLGKDAQLWMSVTPAELQSQAHHAHAAYGEVLICGLGMGALPHAIMQRKRNGVERITIVEKDERVIRMLHHAAPWSAQLSIVHEDALTYVHPRGVDCLFVDIWPEIASDEAHADTQRIASNNGDPCVVGWWGQEFDFLAWCGKQGIKRDYVPKHMSDWLNELGWELPMFNLSPTRYGEMCLDALNNMHMSSQLEVLDAMVRAPEYGGMNG